MKKLSYLISVLAITISSCTKGTIDFSGIQIGWPGFVIPPNGNYHIPGDTISAFVSGTATSFSYSEQAMLSGNYHIHIGGFNVNGTTKLDLDIENTNPISPGTFTENVASGNPITTIKYTWYDPSGWHSAIPFNSTTNPATIIITSIDTASVKGTFKGDLRFISNSGSSIIKSISNGVFNVKF